MIRTDFIATTHDHDAQIANSITNNSPATPTAHTDKAAPEINHNMFSPSTRGVASRMGEFNAGTSLMKARMLSATAVNTHATLSNGQIATVYPPSGGGNKTPTIYIN